MMNRYIWIGMVAGVFFVGLGIGYALFYSQSTHVTPQQMQQIMNDPQSMQQMQDMMMNNPRHMNRWMGTMMQDPDLRQQYMGPWMMMRDPQFMQNMRDPWFQKLNLEESAVQTNTVSIPEGAWQYQSTNAFSPSVIKVSAGTTVTWTNDDTIIHTVTDLEDVFDSGLIQAGESWMYKFDQKGTLYYLCSIHPWMKGVVIVS